MKFVCLRYPKLQMTFRPDIVREVNGTILKTRAEIIQFVDGQYETTDPEKIKFIKAHTNFNVSIFASEEEKYQHPAISETEKVEATVKVKKGRPKKIV